MDILPEGILDENLTLTLEEFSRLCAATKSDIIEMVQVGILTPKGKKTANWQFSIFHLQRFQKARRLQLDLNLNIEGVALSLELLDQIRQLQKRLNSLERHFKLLARI